MTSLEGWDSAIELPPRGRSRSPRGAGNPPPVPAVGEGGFEPPTACPQSRCATAAPLPGAPPLYRRAVRERSGSEAYRQHRLRSGDDLAIGVGELFTPLRQLVVARRPGVVRQGAEAHDVCRGVLQEQEEV